MSGRNIEKCLHPLNSFGYNHSLYRRSCKGWMLACRSLWPIMLSKIDLFRLANTNAMCVSSLHHTHHTWVVATNHFIPGQSKLISEKNMTTFLATILALFGIISLQDWIILNFKLDFRSKVTLSCYLSSNLRRSPFCLCDKTTINICALVNFSRKTKL